MLRKFLVDRYVSRDPLVLFGKQAIGRGIERARRARRLTQARLAYQAELDPSTISKLEHGRLEGMRLGTLARVVAALNGEIDFLDDATVAALTSPKPTPPARRP